MSTATAVRERPILFSAPMVRAILEGRKTQTRRICKVQPQVTSDTDASWRDASADLWRNAQQYARDCCPFGVVGDRLWVRETWTTFYADQDDGDTVTGDVAVYFADYEDDRSEVLWRPSIHMPRRHSRITLEITDVRVERIQDISEDDALADGGWEYKSCPIHKSPIRSFAELWNQINGAGSWDSSPWVWAISFRRIEE